MTMSSLQTGRCLLYASVLGALIGALAGARSAAQPQADPIEQASMTLDCTQAAAPQHVELRIEYVSLSALEQTAAAAEITPAPPAPASP